MPNLGGSWMGFDELSETRRKRERGSSNKEFLEENKDMLENAEQVHITVVYSDGTIEGAFSGGPTAPILGALEWSKFQVLRQAEEE